MKLKNIILLSFVILIGQNIHSQNNPNLYRKADPKAMRQWVDSVFDKLSLEERIGQLFMVVADPSSSDRKRILANINEQKVGGILFAKGSLADQAASTNIYQKASRVPLLITFDGEWGLGMRLAEAPRFPTNMLLGAISDDQLIYNYGEEVARECRELGVHVNFAPDIDVNNNPNNPVIGTRSFGERPDLVARKGIAYAKGLESLGVMAVGKHFPGHGDTSDDSHETLPVIRHDRKRLDEVELPPFVQYIREGFAGMMNGHLKIPALDSSKYPSSLSPKIVNGLLQTELGFRGLTFTDALEMKGAVLKDSSACVMALLAGNDILLKPNNTRKEFDAVMKAVENGVIPIDLIEAKCIKVLQYKYIAGLNHYQPIKEKGLLERINTSYARWLVLKLNSEGVTLLKNTNDILPLKRLNKKKIAVLSLGNGEESEFHKTLARYATVDYYNIPRNANQKTVDAVFDKLAPYNTILCAVHSERTTNYQALQQLAVKKELHFCFFTSPYFTKQFKSSITNAQSLVVAYENTSGAQQSAAELLMGGIPAKGKLPVSIPGMYTFGDGLSTRKTRLSYQEPLEVELSAQKLSQIDAIVREGIRAKAFPGCQVLVAKDGVVVYNKAFGYFDYANTHPVQLTDVYDLASVTKATATLPAVMKLYDQKKITLNQPLSQNIPELKGSDKQNITVREALLHQSGLPSFLPFYTLLIDKDSYTGRLYASKRDATFRTLYDTNVYMRNDFEFRADRVSPISKAGFTVQVAKDFYVSNKLPEIMLEEIKNAPLKKKDAYLYSDLNFMLLKELVENVSGRTLDAFVRDEFYAKLGANYTMFHPLQKIDTTRIAPTENDEFLRNQVLIGFPHDETAALMGGVSGNAGLFSNTNDLAKLLQMLLNEGEYGGERYMNKETCHLFTTTKSAISRRGLGFDKPDKLRPASSPTGELASASTYGHTGYSGTCFWVDPDKGLIYIFLSNRVYPSRTHKKLMELNIRTRIQDIIYEALK